MAWVLAERLRRFYKSAELEVAKSMELIQSTRFFKG